jgi:Na+/glutamate symporter
MYKRLAIAIATVGLAVGTLMTSPTSARSADKFRTDELCSGTWGEQGCEKTMCTTCNPEITACEDCTAKYCNTENCGEPL